jgi:putative transcriptional regulator
MDAIHETASGLHRLGFIDKRKMTKYDLLCLEPVPDYSSTKIRTMRRELNISQPVLASVLNTSVSAVKQWERGVKKPSGSSLKLLHLIDRKGIEAVL